MCVDTLINLGVAVGTIAVAVLAIWGDRIIDFLNPAKARIVLHNIDGRKEGGPAQGGTVISYHLKVVNTTRWKTLQNCRVPPTDVLRKGADGRFYADLCPVPRQFVWAPSELAPIAVSFSKNIFWILERFGSKILIQASVVCARRKVRRQHRRRSNLALTADCSR